MSLFAFVLPILLGTSAGGTYTINRDSGPGAPAEESSGPHSQGYVDPAGWISAIPAGIPDGVFQEFADEGRAMAALEDGDIEGFFIIPADYLESGDLTFVTLEFNPVSNETNLSTFNHILTLNLFGEDAALGSLVLEPYTLKMTEIASDTATPEADNWMADQLPFFMVLLLYMVILIPASSLVTSITNEKKNRVLEILLSSVSPSQFFIGKLLALGLLGFLQPLIWLLTMWGVARYGSAPLNLPPGLSIPTGLMVWAVLFAVMGYAMYGTQMAGIGALAPNLNDTRSLTLIVLSPMIVGYTFNIIFLEAPNSIIAVILSLFPLTGPVVMIGRLASASIPIWQPILSLLLQMGAVVWIVRVYTRLFRAQALLSGQELNFKRLVKALRTPRNK